MPTKVGLSFKGKQLGQFNLLHSNELGLQLVSANLDKLDLLTKDLQVAPKDQENPRSVEPLDEDNSCQDSKDYKDEDDKDDEDDEDHEDN